MPWNNNTGGWKGGGGGPWGSGPQQPNPQRPPDLEELLRRSQDRLRNALPSGGRGNGVIALVVVAVLAVLWLMKAFYIVEPNELGQEMVFGKPKDEVAQQGLHFHFWPVETVEKVSTAQRNDIIPLDGARRTADDASLMLSGDQNIVDITFSVIWLVSDPKQFLFNVEDPDAFVRRVAESAMREIVGRSRAEDVRTERRADVEDAVRQLVQTTLDAYNAGIRIVSIQLERADPPAEVADSFEEVQRAQQDQERFQRQAEAYANQRLGEARGEASQIREQARGYREASIAEAQGESQRFAAVLEEYSKAKDVTRKRLFLENMEQVLRSSNKVIMENQEGGQGTVPYLSLNELQRQTRQPRPGAQQGGEAVQQGTQGGQTVQQGTQQGGQAARQAGQEAVQ